jgi:hypothetical protein
MKRSIATRLAVLAAVTVAPTGYATDPAISATPPAVVVTATSVVEAVPVAIVQSTPVQDAPVGTLPAAPLAAPAHAAPAAPIKTIAKVATPDQTAPQANTSEARTAYINAMYLAVVPARQRAMLAGRYVLGYNLPGVGCGTGCTGLFNGQARSSFNATFFSESIAYQRNTLAHEAAHAYGFLMLTNYTTASWAGLGGWQAHFNAVDRSFAGPNDAEAWAACVAWQESGFNDRIDQIAHPCTAQAAALAMAQIS